MENPLPGVLAAVSVDLPADAADPPLATARRDYSLLELLENLQHLELNYTLTEIEIMPKQAYRNMIKKKISEYLFKYLLEN